VLGSQSPALLGFTLLAIILTQVCVHLSSRLFAQQQARQEQLRLLSEHDPLTGLANRRSFTQAFDTARHQYLRKGWPLAMLMLDIDHFKRINDRWGHASGDVVLQALANTCLAGVRPSDTVARIGGEEFCILLPGATLQEATATAERLRRVLADCRCAPVDKSGQPRAGNAGAAEPIRFTASFGVTEALADAAGTLDALLNAADARLYAAKAAGRNCVVASSDHPAGPSTDTPATSAPPLALGQPS